MGRGLLGKRLIKFSFEFVARSLRLGELTLKIGNILLEIGQCAVGRRAHGARSPGEELMTPSTSAGLRIRRGRCQSASQHSYATARQIQIPRVSF